MKKTAFLLLCMLTYIACFFSLTSIVESASINRDEKPIIMIVLADNQVSLAEKMKRARHYPGITIRKVYESVLTGFSIEGKRDDITAFKRIIGDSYFHEVNTYIMNVDDSVPFIGGRAIRGYFDEQGNRLTGKGVKVGVIDTGVDYNHPDLRRSYKGGRDLVDEDNDPMETLSPSAYATLHGTHVAGIIAANGKRMGVAPETEIYAYRALGPGGAGTSEGIIAAVEAAVADKMDIINLSLGNTINGPDLPITMALNKAVELGVTAIVSSGNSGPRAWSVGSPGTSTKAISVGASFPPIMQPFLEIGFGQERRRVLLQQIYGARKWSYYASQQLVNGGFGTKKELKDVKGHIVLIQRGTESLQTKIQHAQAMGATGVIIYNNKSGSFLGSLTKNCDIPAVTISQKDGHFLRKQLRENGNQSVRTVMVKIQDRLAAFSSRGPVTISWEIKPDVVAPGVEIASTVPGGYMSLQGTSMAAPHVAGAAALLKQAHPEWTPDQIKSALMTTAKLLRNQYGELYKTYEQGAGRIQIDRAVLADTFFYPSSLTFGLFDRKKGEHQHVKELEIENKSKYVKHYSFNIPKDDVGLLWSMPFSVDLQPNEKRKVKIALSINSQKIKKGVFQGYFIVKEGTYAMHIPYIYMKDEPDYPRIMGFYFSEDDQPQTYKFEMYVPGGGDELTIALYDVDTYRFVGILNQESSLPKGWIERKFTKKELPPPGIYHAVIVLKKGSENEDYHKIIQINP